MTPDEFIAAARTMQGARFRHQGRSPEHGLDCAGLAVCAARKCGMEVRDRIDYARAPNWSDFQATLLDHFDQVPLGQQRPGDALLMAFGGTPQHLAIMTEANPPRMIHAFATMRKVVEHDIDATWSARIRAVFRIREN